MKHHKMLYLLLAAAASLLAFANSAAASPVLTSPKGTEYTGEIHATLATPNSSLFKAGVEVTCGESTRRGTITTNNETHASGAITQLSTGDCSKTVTVLRTGSLTVAASGAVTDIGDEVTVFDLGVSCVYGGGPGTKIGTLKEGEPAKIEVSTTKVAKISGGFLCATEATWTASYTITTPKGLWLN